MISTRRLIAVIALASSASLGWCAPAFAAPEWDIERYDDCMKAADDETDPSKKLAWTRKCCLDSGGVWNDSLGSCQTPPAQPTQWRPGMAPRPGMATQSIEPAAPGVTRVPVGVLTQT